MADLATLFGASLSPDKNTRISAELELIKIQSIQGLLPQVLHLVLTTQDVSMKQSAVVWFKNRIQRHWESVAPSDKDSIKASIIPALVSVQPKIKIQLVGALSTIIDFEFPDSWPDLLPGVVAGLNSGHEAQIEGSLIALQQIFRKYRYFQVDRSVPDSLTAQVMPTLVQLGSHMLASTPQPASPENVGRMLHLIFKIYRLSIATDLSSHHQDIQASLIPWGTLFLQVVNRQLDPDALPKDEEAREKCEWWKAKKWAYFNLNRLFLRFGSPSQLSSSDTHLKSFAQVFESQFAPEIFKAYLRQAELYVGSLSNPSNTIRYWQSSRCRKFTIDFFSECVKPSRTWSLLRPHLPLLLKHYAFPPLCPTDDDLESFAHDPVDYIKQTMSEIVADFYARPETAAYGLLDTLVHCRKKSTLGPLLAFINDIVSAYPQTTSAKEKEGALKILGHLADPIVASREFGGQMEQFFLTFILPEFKSPHGFLRARACQLVNQFEAADMTWNDPTHINLLFEGVSQAMVDPELPVRVAAALALPELIRYEQLRQAVVPNIGRIMQELLKLCNEIDLDVMMETMRKLVEDFADELLPFTEALTESLVSSFLRMMQEQLEARESEQDELALEEQCLAAMGTLKTIQQLLASIPETQPETLARVERLIVPAIAYCLKYEFLELYDELFEIINQLTYFRKQISPEMWQVFVLIHGTFKANAHDYINEMMSSLDNFISFGAQTIAANPQYVDMLLDIFVTAMTHEHLGAADRAVVCKLAESMFLNLRGQIDRVVPIILEHCVSIITRTNTSEEPVITSTLYLHALSIVVNAMYYSPHLTVAFLDAHHATAAFFTKWTKRLKTFNRAHDRKLGVMAVITTFQALPVLPPHVTQAAPLLLAAAVQMLHHFDVALTNRLGLEDDFGDEEFDYDDLFRGGKPKDDVDDDQDVVYEDADYENILRNKLSEKLSAKLEEGDDDSDDDAEWEEEILFESPLDNLDIFAEFAKLAQYLEQQQQGVLQQIPDGVKGQMRDILTIAQQGGEPAMLAKLKAERAAAAVASGKAS